MRLTVFIRHEGAGYWGEVSELPGCFASGRTLTELREALGEAIGLYLWDRPAQLGEHDLRPGTAEVCVIDLDGAAPDEST
jgi:predicted RNase H-like HicB family nuclease